MYKLDHKLAIKLAYKLREINRGGRKGLPRKEKIMAKQIQHITHKLDKFSFGKHKGLTARRVIEIDPSYIMWCDSEGIVKFSAEILDSANDNMVSHTFDNLVGGEVKSIRYFPEDD